MSEALTEIRPHEQVLLIAILKRSLDTESSRQIANEILTAAVRQRGIPVVLDMSQVRFAPSSALGVLVQLSKSFRLDARRLALIAVQPQVLGPIRVTNLHTLVEIHDTLDQVLQPKTNPR
jgi:anti-anti-sigma factor